MSAAPLPPPAASGGRARRPTATARFGSSRRESHDATSFYERFHPPEISADTDVVEPGEVDVIHVGDARDMSDVQPASVALVVTSPPYFAGKEYEAALGVGGVPATYFEYLAMLREVFARCARVLEPGGRLAVNVANLGRRPYRSLAGDVTDILQELGLLLRGEVVWWKGRAAGGSCAWGSFQRPANPVLRDVTERIVIASKGRFDRALTPRQRRERGLPARATITRDEFLEATTDLWEMAPESATRVGHPAPFPVELPTRLIELYTYEGDLVLDPFMGAGTTAVAAVRTGRHFLGFDTDPAYVERARRRVDEERRRRAGDGGLWPAAGSGRWAAAGSGRWAGGAEGPAGGAGGAALGHAGGAGGGGADDVDRDLDRALADGRQVREIAELVLRGCGFGEVRADVRRPGAGVEASFTARDQAGGEWAFDLSGALTTTPSGLRRRDGLWRAIGRAAVLHQSRPEVPVVLLTTSLPAPGGGHAALDAVRGPGGPVFDVVGLLDPGDRRRLRRWAEGGPSAPGGSPAGLTGSGPRRRPA